MDPRYGAPVPIPSLCLDNIKQYERKRHVAVSLVKNPDNKSCHIWDPESTETPDIVVSVIPMSLDVMRDRYVMHVEVVMGEHPPVTIHCGSHQNYTTSVYFCPDEKVYVAPLGGPERPYPLLVVEDTLKFVKNKTIIAFDMPVYFILNED